MSLHQMLHKTGMVVKAPSLSLWKPIVEGGLPICFYKTKAKGRIFFTGVGWELLHFSGMQIFSLRFLQGDQEHLLTLKEKHKIPADAKPFFFIL